MVEENGFLQMDICRGQGCHCHRAIIEESGEHMTSNRGCSISPLGNPIILFLFIPMVVTKEAFQYHPSQTPRLDIGTGPAEAQGNGKLPRLSSGCPSLSVLCLHASQGTA